MITCCSNSDLYALRKIRYFCPNCQQNRLFAYVKWLHQDVLAQRMLKRRHSGFSVHTRVHNKLNDAEAGNGSPFT
jgi:hypothetical protein